MNEKTKKVNLSNENKEKVNSGNDLDNNTLFKDKEDPGYVKKIITEQDVYTSGVIYRYINNVDPNKDLITDTALYGGPLKIETVPDK